MTTERETSLSLAEDFVREKLRAETFEQGLHSGDEIDVDGMENCDCIPLSVSVEAGWHRIGSPAGEWSLERVRRKGSCSSVLVATYKWSAK